MIITVASGKGGTGKTTVATNLALAVSSLVKDVQLLDCDVEEPNAHFFIDVKTVKEKSVFVSIPKVNEEKCTHCRKCAEICAYHAIAVFPKKVLISLNLCHSCDACQYFCLQKAISEIERSIGVIKKGQKDNLEFIYGELKVGEAMAVPVIKSVKKYIQPN